MKLIDCTKCNNFGLIGCKIGLESFNTHCNGFTPKISEKHSGLIPKLKIKQ